MHNFYKKCLYQFTLKNHKSQIANAESVYSLYISNKNNRDVIKFYKIFESKAFKDLSIVYVPDNILS